MKTEKVMISFLYSYLHLNEYIKHVNYRQTNLSNASSRASFTMLSSSRKKIAL